MVVVDTSIAYKWFSKEGEDLLSQAIRLLKNHLEKHEALIAPDIIIYELANAWATKTQLTHDQIKIFMKDFSSTRIKIEAITFDLINHAILFSKKYHVSVYDASYAVLAREKRCDYYTADIKFVERVNLPFIKHLKNYVN